MAAPWQELGESVRRFLGARLADPHRVDDLAQEVLLQAAQRLEAGERIDHLPAWLLQVARRRLVDHFRQRGRQAGTVPVVEVAGPEDDEDREAAAVIDRCLHRHLAELDQRDAELLRRIYWEGASQAELSAAYGLSEPGLRAAVQRARQRLGAALRRCCGPAGPTGDCTGDCAEEDPAQ